MKALPVAILIAAWLAVPSRAAAEQDALARAKELYVTAAYDEALALLDTVPPSAASDETIEAAQYRIFCLLALNRNDDARQAIAAMVNANPSYRLPEGQTSPRIESVFRTIRRQVFPDVVQHAYSDAKAAYDRHDETAAARFERVVSLLDDPDARGVAALADLRTIAVGFRDLTKAAAKPAPEPPPQPMAPAPPADPVAEHTPPTAEPPPPAEKLSPSAEKPPSSAGSTETPPPSTGGTVTIVPPVAIYQPIPPWVASRAADEQQFRGSLELVIDRTGHVTNVKLRKSINPRYDAELLRVARTWRYRPATKNGEPTPFVKVVEVQLVARDE